jgi:hypothetical protein
VFQLDLRARRKACSTDLRRDGRDLRQFVVWVDEHLHVLNWADSHAAGYETWDTWGTCGSLIGDYNGTPPNEYATWVKAHYAAKKADAPTLPRK